MSSNILHVGNTAVNKILKVSNFKKKIVRQCEPQHKINIKYITNVHAKMLRNRPKEGKGVACLTGEQRLIVCREFRVRVFLISFI